MMREKRYRAIAEINVVPYIDVMLVLLVIFMITAPLLNQGVQIDLPKATAKVLDSKQQEPLIVSINQKGQYFLNVSNQPDKAIEPEQLATRVAAELVIAKQAGIQRQVLVKGDRHSHYGQVVQAMVLLQNAGAETVGLMTEQPETVVAKR